MNSADIKVGSCYAAKSPKSVGLFDRRLNDRQVLWMDSLRDTLQYDSPSVKDGRHHPKVKVEAFANWAGRDVTAEMPAGEWRTEK